MVPISFSFCSETRHDGRSPGKHTQNFSPPAAPREPRTQGWDGPATLRMRTRAHQPSNHLETRSFPGRGEEEIVQPGVGHPRPPRSADHFRPFEVEARGVLRVAPRPRTRRTSEQNCHTSPNHLSSAGSCHVELSRKSPLLGVCLQGIPGRGGLPDRPLFRGCLTNLVNNAMKPSG